MVGHVGNMTELAIDVVYNLVICAREMTTRGKVAANPHVYPSETLTLVSANFK